MLKYSLTQSYKRMFLHRCSKIMEIFNGLWTVHSPKDYLVSSMHNCSNSCRERVNEKYNIFKLSVCYPSSTINNNGFASAKYKNKAC